MPDQTIVASFEQQFGKSWDMLRDAIGRLDDDHWHGGDLLTDVPSRSALHVVQCARFYIWEGTVEAFDWNRGGCSWHDAAREQLPSREDMLRSIDGIEADTRAWLQKKGDAGLVAPDDRKPMHFASGVERMLYALRHLQHHVAQISQESKRRGDGAAAWR